MFNQHQEVVIDSTGDVVLLLVEENAFKRVYVQFIGIRVAGTENGVTK